MINDSRNPAMRKELPDARRPVSPDRMRQAAVVAEQPSPVQKAQKPFVPVLPELKREDLDPFSRLVYDANSYLTGYLDALKAAGAQKDSRSFNRA